MSQSVVSLPHAKPRIDFRKVLNLISYEGRTPGAWTPRMCEIRRQHDDNPDIQRIIDAIIAVEQTQPLKVRKTVTRLVDGVKTQAVEEEDVRVAVGPQDVDRVRAKRNQMDALRGESDVSA